MCGLRRGVRCPGRRRLIGVNPKDRVRVVAPTYALANAWASEHEISRRRLWIAMTPSAVAELKKGTTVVLVWPTGSRGCSGLLDALLDRVNAGELMLVHS